jgi:hypothetical protein
VSAGVLSSFWHMLNVAEIVGTDGTIVDALAMFDTKLLFM